MTAIFVIKQRNAVHMMTDGAAYLRPSGIITSIDCKKAVAMPSLHAVVACTGPWDLGAFYAKCLPTLVASFDELVDRADVLLPKVFKHFAEARRGGDAVSTLYLIGWHRRRDEPGCYAIDMWSEGGTQIDRVKRNALPGQAMPTQQRLIAQDASGTPMPSPARAAEAGFRLADDNEKIEPEIDLLHLLEVGRQERVDNLHWVGGNAMLTTLTRGAIDQRVIHKWQEDRIGEKLAPRPVNWKSWIAARRLAAAPIPSGLSRLQRERMEKKARKGTLRAVDGLRLGN